MLEPQSRQLLLDALHPPEGYRLDWAVGTTYSLDLMAILSATVAFAFSEWHDQDGGVTRDPLALLKAVRQYADRICLFCQAGKIHVPRSYQPLLTDLEKSIVGIVVPRGGSFHAKLWFLRYLGGADAVTYRLLCLSRNMTFDRSWDTMLSLEGEFRDRIPAFRRNHPLGEFVEALPAMAVPPELSPVWCERLTQLAYEIRRVDFQVPTPFEDVAFWSLGTAGRDVWPFPECMDKLLVVAPFVDDQFVEELTGQGAAMQLVSRPESLALLQPETVQRFEGVWVLDGAAEPETVEIEGSESARPSGRETDGDGHDAAPADVPLVGLHAKVYVADCGRDAHVWTGSANATGAGFHRNVEVLVQLTGKRGPCGVDAVLGQSEKSSGKHVACLADLLQPYKARQPAETTSQAERDFERKAQALACALASARPEALCTPSTDAATFSLRIRPGPPTSVPVPEGWEIRARPISLPEAFTRPVDLTATAWVDFDRVSLDRLTSFFAFEIRSPVTTLPPKRFVLNLPLEGAPENRREHVLRMLLSDRGRVLHFLLLLLMDHDARDFGTWFPPASGHEPRSAVHPLFGSTLFESLVRALDREPGRIDQVAEVIHGLEQTPEGKRLLPEGLETVWAPVWEVRQRQRAAQGGR